FATPTGLTAQEGFPLRNRQALYREVDGTRVPEYQADLPVTKDGGTGHVVVMVVAPGDPTLTGTGCAFASSFWGEDAASCQDVPVARGTVGLATGAPKAAFDSWAGYRHPDGTVVFVAQSDMIPR